MRIVCLNIERAVAQLEKFSDPCSEALIQVLRDHAVNNQEVVIDASAGYITSMTFTATQAVDVELEVDDTVIVIHEVGGIATATVSINPKETTMDTNNQTQTSSTPPVYSAEERDALMAKMASMQAAMDEMSKARPKAATAKAAAPSEEDNGLALAIGKGILYTAGAVAVGTAGFFAWKKWGPNSSTQA